MKDAEEKRSAMVSANNQLAGRPRRGAWRQEARINCVFKRAVACSNVKQGERSASGEWDVPKEKKRKGGRKQPQKGGK